MSTPDVTDALFENTCRAINDGDMDYWRRVLVPDVFVVGSAPGEEYRGRDALIEAMAGYGPIPCKPGPHEGRVIGDALWCYGHITAAGVPARLTLVAAASGDDWLITHWHLSVAVPDEEVSSDWVRPVS